MPTADELLYAPLLKLERARQHINDLNARVDEFLATKPFVLMERHERKAGRTAYYIKVKQPIPPEFSLIIGDAAHNIRAALDIVLFGMVGDREPKIQFPFPRDPTPEALKRAIKERHVEAAGEKVVETITRLEPNASGKDIALYLAHALDVQDKHRLLILAGHRAAVIIGYEGDELLRGIVPDDTPVGSIFVLYALENADAFTIERTYATRALGDSENEAKTQPPFAITFGEREILRGIPVGALAISAKEAERAVRELVSAFLDPDNTLPT